MLGLQCKRGAAKVRLGNHGISWLAFVCCNEDSEGPTQVMK